MRLGVRAPVCSLTGYAEFGREVISSLERQGAELFVEPLDSNLLESSKQTLPLGIIDLLERTHKPIPNNVPILTVGTPPEFDTEHGTLKVGIGLFEAFSVPQPWLIQMGRMDLILTLSEFNREVFVRHGISRDKIALIPPAIDCKRFHSNVVPFYVGVVRPFTILFVGQLILRKGWDKLLIAALRTFRTHDDVCIILKLPPPQFKGARNVIVKRLREVKKEAGGSKVHVYGNDSAIPVEKVPRVYQIARKIVPRRIYRFLNGSPLKGVFALPSLGEGIGLPYLEAWASGLLVLGTRSTGQAFLNPENSIIVESGPPVRDLRVELESTLYRGAPFPSVSVGAVSDALLRAYNLSDYDREKIEQRAKAEAQTLTYDKCTHKILEAIESRL